MADENYYGCTVPYDEDNEPIRREQHRRAENGEPIPCAEDHCNQVLPIRMLFKCLYCLMWFCKDCAEHHYGKTREEWFADKEKEDGSSGPTS